MLIKSFTKKNHNKLLTTNNINIDDKI